MNAITAIFLTLVTNQMLASSQNISTQSYNEPLTTVAVNGTDDSVYINFFKGNNKTVLFIFVVVWPIFLISIALYFCVYLSTGESTRRVVNYELVIFLFAFLNIGFLITLFVPKKSFLKVEDVIVNGLVGVVTTALLFNTNIFIYGRLKSDYVAWKTSVRRFLIFQSIVVGFVCGGIAYWKGKYLDASEALNYLFAVLMVAFSTTISSCPLFLANWFNAEEDQTRMEDMEKSVSFSFEPSVSIGYPSTSTVSQTRTYPQQSTMSPQSTYSRAVAKLPKGTSMKVGSTVTEQPSKESTFLGNLHERFSGIKAIFGYGEYMVGKGRTKEETKQPSENAKDEGTLPKESKVNSKLADEDKKFKVTAKSPSLESTGMTFFKEQLSKGKVKGKEVTSFSVYGQRMFKR